MIARIWHGRTSIENYDAYTEFLRKVAIPDYQQTKGFLKLSFLRRIEGDVAHFNLITYWENLEVIKHFAGDDYELAKYYADDVHYLLEFEDKVVHYEVFA